MNHQHSDTSRVAVVIPCFNHGRYLAEALESVRRQSLKDWECIVVDNGSGDNTREVAQRFVKLDGRFKYTFIEQAGVSAARNQGVSLTTAPFILPLDADDRIGDTYLEKAAAVLASNRSVKVVYCEARLFGARSGKWHLPPFNFRELLIENMLFATALFRREDFERAGGYNEQMREGFEDWDFWISMLAHGGEVVQLAETLFYYRIRHGSRNNSLTKDRQLALRRQVFENHRLLYEQHFNLPDVLFELSELRKKQAQLVGSRAWRFTRYLLAPLRLLRK